MAEAFRIVSTTMLIRKARLYVGCLKSRMKTYRYPDSGEFLKTDYLDHLLFHQLRKTKRCRSVNMNINSFHMHKLSQHLRRAPHQGSFTSSPKPSCRIEAVTASHGLLPCGILSNHSSSIALVLTLEFLLAASFGGKFLDSVG